MASYHTLSDQELLYLLRDGDKLAYTEIYTRYKSLLQNHAYKKLGDFEEVKDVLQELFTQLWIKREKLTETTKSIRLSIYIYAKQGV